ncbi:PREDICTED: A-kinase anchor protein 11 [Nanorana parkeri]|uniref:A-kinase anchor protein 11 n=1 Tax=Nanorana parkeri TaxID=125878 RepID=UPI0008545457|nr:PREDICTED: A-kinase anchor protein 11 [Nanorana parkeri]
MDTCTRSQGSQMKPKVSVKKENISEGLLSSVKSVLQSRKELCSITDCLKSCNKEDFIEITFLGLSRESGLRNIQGITALYVDVPELLQSPHLCNLNENEVILMKDGKEAAKSSTMQNYFSGSLCMMTSAPLSLFKSDYVYVLLSKYSAGVQYAVDQGGLNQKADHHEDDDTNHSVSSIEDDFVTAFEHLDEEDPINTNDLQGLQWGSSTNQRDAASQTQPSHCLDITGSKIIFSSVHRRSSIKSTVLMSYLGHQDLPLLPKNVGNTSCDAWKHGNCQGKNTISPSSAETSDSECSSPSPIIFLDEEGYQKSLRAKLSLPKIPVGKEGVEDSDSEISEFFDSFDRFDELDPCLEDNDNKPILGSPPKKRKHAKVSVSTVCMNPQKFKFDRPTLSASIKKPTPRKAESPFSSIMNVPESPRPAKTCAEDNGSLFSPIRSSAFSPPGSAIGSEGSFQPASQNEAASCKGKSYVAFSNYANRVCADMFDSVLKPKPSSELAKKEPERFIKLKRKSNNKESERRMKTKHKSIKGGIQKFAADLVEKSFGSAFKDLQRGVSSCTSALCHLAARLTSYVFQMAFYEIGRRQAFSIKKQAINGLANLMVSEVMTSALQELRYIKKQMVTNAVTRFAADLAEELVFEGIMEVCQFSHPPTPNVSSDTQAFDYEDVVVSSYAKDLSESVIQEAFIELSQVNVTFTTEAAISVSMDNLKYVGSEGLHQSTPSSSSSLCVHNLASPAPNEPKRDFTVHYALLFTSGLMSSVPVPVAAKVLSQHSISTDHTDLSTNNMCMNNADNHNFSRKDFDGLPSDKAIFSAFTSCVNGSQQEQRYVDFIKEDADGVKPFSVTMVDMIVNEAYDVIKSAKTVEDYADMMTKRIIEIPPQHRSLEGGAPQQQFANDLAKGASWHPSGKNAQSLSNRWDASKCNCDISVNFLGYHTQVEHTSLNPCFTAKSSAKDRKSGSANKHASLTLLGNSNNANNKASLGGLTARLSVDNSEVTDPPLFGLQSCFPHINSFSSVLCTCGDDFFMEDRNSHNGSNVTLLPGTPPSTPLMSYDMSPVKSMRKLSKRLKGQLAKEFYPSTPPSTPHLSAYEQNNMKKDDFMLKLMRSLSEEVESSSSDESSEEFEVSEETCQYAEYLSSNIISIATDMAASSLVDESVQAPPMRNRSQLSILSDKWGYPAYMRNITEDLLETLCSYANCVAGEVISDAKEVLGSRKNSACDLEYSNSRKSDKDCRPKERGHNYTSFKSSDATTLPLPHYGGGGLTSKYPSCESVTEEYADHLIRVLKMEGGSSELIMDQYASRLVYRAMKSGLQQASKTVKLKCNRKIMPRMKPEASSNKDLFRLLGRTHHAGKDRRQSNVILPSFTDDSAHKTEFNRLIHFAESLANTITCDVKKRLKLSAASLPKSLTDSCLYTKSRNDYVSGEIVKTSFPKTPLLFSHKQKLYHSTGSLNDNGYSESFIQAIEQYACKVVDSTLEFSLERARLQAMENRRKTDKDSNAAKLVHSYGTACRLCSAKEQQGNPLSSCHFLLGHDVSRKIKQCAKSKQNSGQKSRLFHLNIPKIQIDLDKRAMFADKIVSAAIEKAERELSNTSLAGDSGIGHDGVSFAESLTTEILMSAMKNIGQVVNISSIGKDGFQSVDSVTSQQTSVSVGDDSTGSWSNLSFEDEHQDESSSFLHLSDSNGNSSSWSSLGLEGDMCEENVSFPPSDSDGAEEKDEDLKVTTEVGGQQRKSLLIRNLDLGPSTVESQMRTILQWIAASECDISELYFPENAIKDHLLLFRRIREKGWKTGDLLQAVLQYCESSETSLHLPNPLFGWLLEKV